MKITIEESKQRKTKPQRGEPLGFGKYFSDHMFVMDWSMDQGFHDARIIPYGNLSMDPASMVLHYAQETFEGLKAYRAKDGRILLFRPDMNAKRFINSNRRLCMAEVSEADFIEAIRALVEFEQDWVPDEAGTSLYIRPFMFASEAAVGVHPAKSYKFVIILSPVGAYYPQGVNPVKIYVEDEYVRATKGGTGFAKCGGNYASSIAAQMKAEKLGYTQVLWLDGVERKYVEEVGTMNVMFKINGEIVTAPCDGTVLPGVTRDSILTLLREWGYTIKEEHLAIDDLMAAARCGQLEEAWGTGTAAVISPIGELNYKGEITTIHQFKTGPLTQRLYDTLTGIQWGDIEDTHGWVYDVMKNKPKI
ncbi:MAG: branched-chain amino acid aminotransferase [Erysipelotrichaceae bacterium]|nr:branched-chain amino acid aminotransferase [Erysipelotrichaceae bacterium]MCI9312545.1 branched-chain amino acid aminotransferase [Erysipelotrichaceae bacterium]